MKFSSASGLLAFTAVATAFPATLFEDLKRATPEQLKRSADLARGIANDNGDAPVFPGDYIFSESQLIDVTGAHAFTPPSGNDLRGPCPGLNAFANHNYLPHNGFASTSQFVQACMSVVGMGELLAGFLAGYGAFVDGDGSGWSIGGQVPGAGASKGNGITNSHNKYESDASPTRPDLYQEGNDYMTKVNQFQEMINTQPNAKTANYNIQVLTDFRAKRFNEQVASNPYFFNGPFTGVLVQPAAYTFIYRFMANHSSADPVGVLNQDVLKSWFAISGNSGSYSVKQGWEQIPANWYRRSLSQPYEVDYFGADVFYAAAKYPQFLNIGGNTGKPNSFVGIDLNPFSGNTYNSSNIAQGDNAQCLAYQYAAQEEPDSANYLAPIFNMLNCPELKKIDDAQLKQYPGYNKAYTPV